MQILEMGIRGMTCAACAARIEKAVRKVQGVASARVNLAVESARVEFDESVARPGELTAAIEGAGYTPIVEVVEFPIRGMTCASCVARVERVLNKLHGVIEARVNLASESARVRYSPASAGLPEFRKAIGEAGYEVPEEATQAADSAGDAQRERELALMRRELAVGIGLSIPVAVLAMGMYYPPFLHWLESC